MNQLDVSGGRIAYEVVGEGPLVVGVHGMGDNRSTFRLLVPGLVAAGYRVAVMDVRGYGQSSARWERYDHAAVGEDLLALVRELGGRATVIAHSIGCAAAVRAAVERPDEIDGLVLIGTFAGGTKPKAWMRAASWLVARTPGLWGMFYGSLFAGGKPADHPKAVAALKANLGEPGRMAPLRAQIAESLSGMTVPYGDVRCPVLVLTGTKDPDMADPAEEAQRTAAQLAGARVSVEMIDGAGHLPHLDRVERTEAAVLGFLKGL